MSAHEKEWIGMLDDCVDSEQQTIAKNVKQGLWYKMKIVRSCDISQQNLAISSKTIKSYMIIDKHSVKS